VASDVVITRQLISAKYEIRRAMGGWWLVFNFGYAYLATWGRTTDLWLALAPLFSVDPKQSFSIIPPAVFPLCALHRLHRRHETKPFTNNRVCHAASSAATKYHPSAPVSIQAAAPWD